MSANPGGPPASTETAQRGHLHRSKHGARSATQAAQPRGLQHQAAHPKPGPPRSPLGGPQPKTTAEGPPSKHSPLAPLLRGNKAFLQPPAEVCGSPRGQTGLRGGPASSSARSVPLSRGHTNSRNPATDSNTLILWRAPGPGGPPSTTTSGEMNA
ncbi:hypothetical protein NDU88_009106 [Pleurodeles waltl]|uniref:Uncharacterized protein n=1 Tax=Pleurodeles waltl TaxID=8319 RepID=A0AAV7PWC6_PLEWA|nr:hypothetical protein NDU88_009106 [Pleurodeles waltl]